MEFERSHKKVIKQRLLGEPRRFIQVIYGPRQVGKTTMITQLIKELSFPHHYVSADAVFSYPELWIDQQWDIARAKSKQHGGNEALLIIDEVQKIPNWSEVVKREWDSDTLSGLPLKVVLLGSSRLLLQQGLTESLTGRFEVLYMGHWTFLEMKQAFGFNENQFVWFGGYPGAAEIINDEVRWNEYIYFSIIETTLSRDILQMTRIDKPALLRRLFELGCHYSSQILSYSKIMGQLQDAGNTTTLAHYLSLLDAAGLLTGLEKFDPSMLRQRSSSPKFQVQNTSLMSVYATRSFQEVYSTPERWGRWVESAIGAHLINHSRSDHFGIHYWRHRNFEVDYILFWKERTIGLEVKSGADHKIHGMGEFQKKYNPEKTYMIGKSGIPWEEFLLIDPLELF